ncbi:MAG: SCO family protein [Flavobacteriia bacterium]|nr:SCO family protein [Flavobacteriia bacterium]
MKRIVAIAIITLIGILVAYSINRKKPREFLPIYNPVDLHSEMVDSSILRKGFGHKIGNFSFKNQDGKNITQKTIEGKIFVVEYFFTTCGTICPKMNIQMQRVQKAFSNNLQLKILSFTVNPEIDTVEQMKRYALSHGANNKQWHFLTGSKEELYKLARTSFFVLKPAEAQNLGDAGSDFIHTNNFVLIDKQKRIRGYYDGTNSKEVAKLIKHIQLLMEEE